jgi:hypothetical protein
MNYLGVDPGLTGGLALISDEGRVLRVSKMPITEADLLLELNAMCADEPRAVVEQVGASPQMGVVSAFTFGKGFGGLLMALTAVGVRFDLAVPRKWQGALGCLSGGDKNITKRRAQQLFPDFTITHANADALLLAEYARRFHSGILPHTTKR